MTAIHTHVAIVGSGFGGLGTAIQLAKAGFHDYLVFERASEVGGVWRDNTYPGCACDVESHLYSFSFARNPKWTRSFSPASEIKAYLQSCAERFGVVPKILFDHEITAATWSEDARHWLLETGRGIFTADILVGAVGALSEASIPDLPGLPTFEGPAFHSAQWNHDVDLNGKKVAVIGTGASAIQFVPHVQKQAAKLSVFQRTAPWVVPRRDHAIGPVDSNLAQWLLRARIYALRELTALAFFEPRVARLTQKLAEKHLEKRVKNPDLRRRLTPDYTMGCKRILLSDDYLPAMTQDNVDLVTDPIAEIRPNGVLTKDGVLHEAEVLIFGTGFQVQRFPFAEKVLGREGKTLAETWKNGMSAHLGTTVAGFPNLFLLQGPNTGLGHTSVITMIEAQIEHIVNAAKYMRSFSITSVEPTREAQASFVAEVDRKMKGTVWTSGGCQSWYLDRNGRNSTLWPGFTFTFMRRVKAFHPEEFVLVPRTKRPTGTKVRQTQVSEESMNHV